MSSKKSIKKDIPEADTPKADTLKEDTPKEDTLKEDTPKRKNISPLRYPGGKTRACKKLDEILSEYFDINSFSILLSPFFGGGSFEFYLQNKYDFPIITNDKFTPLYNFWKSAKFNNSELVSKIEPYLGIDKKEFTVLRKNIISLTSDPITQATHYFIINRCSFSGATLSGGFSKEASKKRFTPSSIERVKKLDLTDFIIYNEDFEPFIKKHHTEESILFLDPPYYLEGKSNLYGNNGDMHENFDHKKLADLLSDKINWIMTYNNCSYIRELYKDQIIIETYWSYGMNKSKESSEIVIIG